MPTNGNGPGWVSGSFIVPSWMAATFTTIVGGLGTAVLALINRAPGFHKVIDAQTNTLLDGQRKHIAILEAEIQRLISRIEALENYIVQHEILAPSNDRRAAQ